MAVEYRWAPIVYSRTLNVDFRLLTMPEKMSQDEVDWVLEHISGTTTYADDLRESSRWSLFKNDSLCVFGLTCMAALVSGIKVVADNRDLYLFAGWAARIDKTAYPQAPHHPPIPPLSVIKQPPFWVFRTLYDFVDLMWEDDRTTLSELQKEIGRPFRRVPQMEQILKRNRHLIAEQRKAVAAESDQLNYDGLKLSTIPYESDDQAAQTQKNDMIWAEAALTDKPVSVCLGLPDQSTAIKGPFLNACLRSIPAADLVQRSVELDADTNANAEQRVSPTLATVLESNEPQRMATAMATKHLPDCRFVDIMRDLADRAPSAGSDWICYD